MSIAVIFSFLFFLKNKESNENIGFYNEFLMLDFSMKIEFHVLAHITIHRIGVASEICNMQTM